MDYDNERDALEVEDKEFTAADLALFLKPTLGDLRALLAATA